MLIGHIKSELEFFSLATCLRKRQSSGIRYLEQASRKGLKVKIIIELNYSVDSVLPAASYSAFLVSCRLRCSRTTAESVSTETPLAEAYSEASQLSRVLSPLLELQLQQQRTMFSRVIMLISFTMCSQLAASFAETLYGTKERPQYEQTLSLARISDSNELGIFQLLAMMRFFQLTVRNCRTPPRASYQFRLTESSPTNPETPKQTYLAAGCLSSSVNSTNPTT